MIKVFTPQILAQTAHVRWKEQYFFGDRWYTDDKRRIYEQLCVLGENHTPHTVDTIIGNNTWTTIRCDTCTTYPYEGVIQVGEEDERLDSCIATLCGRCLQEVIDTAYHHFIL